MKKILIPSLLACALYAGEQNFVEIGAGYANIKDNFSTDSDKKNTTFKSPESKTEGFSNINFYYGYDFKELPNIYISSQMGDLKLGSSFKTTQGFFDIGLKASFDKEWENPFLRGVDRKETDTKEYGAYFNYTIPLSSNFEASIVYEYSEKKYKDDNVINILKRDGKRHILGLEGIYSSNVNGKDIQFLHNLNYEKYDANGKASSFDKYGIELGMASNLSERINVFILGNYGKKEYEKSNPKFNKKVEADTYGVVAGMNWDKPFDYKNVYLDFKTGYEKEEANVNFYDKESTFALISLGYKF